jgi:hypothetical protein
MQWLPGAVSPGVKWSEREADHSPPASAEVKKMWIFTSTSSYNFTFTLFPWVRSRDSADGIAIGYGLDAAEAVGVRVPRFVSSPRRPNRFWGPQSPIRWVQVAFSPGVRRLGRATDHTPPT